MAQPKSDVLHFGDFKDEVNIKGRYNTAEAMQQYVEKLALHRQRMREIANPLERLAIAKHTFGEFGGVNKSIEASTTFTVMQASAMGDIFSGKKKVGSADDGGSGCFLYGRHFNPTVMALGREIAAMEGSESAYPCASGMAAISCTLMQLCKSGDHIVASSTVYGGTFALMKEMLPRFGITTTFVDITDPKEVEKAFTPQTKVLYTEVIANPTLRVADLPTLSALAKPRKVTFVVDNTFTPLIISPLKHGADVVIHSLTKYINGASDIIAGCVCGSEPFISSLMDLHHGAFMLFGPTMDPKIAWEISARIPHLALRVKEHSARAMFLATKLSELGMKVEYPGLETFSGHALLTKMMNKEFGYGGMMTLDLGSKQSATSLMDRLQNGYGFGWTAVSLGYFDTLMSCSASSTSSELSDADLMKAGIAPGLVRFSIGITGTEEQRWQQLHAALADLGFVKRLFAVPSIGKFIIPPSSSPPPMVSPSPSPKKVDK